LYSLDWGKYWELAHDSPMTSSCNRLHYDLICSTLTSLMMLNTPLCYDTTGLSDDKSLGGAWWLSGMTLSHMDLGLSGSRRSVR